tara:strand:- start:2742 stop:3476 length:735 start_codon:yes stop_codon:yes gene_type:complete
MPNWKKVIVSGSNAHLTSVTSSYFHTNPDQDDFVFDAAGNIELDADGAVIKLKDGGTEFGRLSRVSSDLVIKSAGNNNDILFKGVDASSTITALQLDMSEGGDAYFTADISGSTIRASGDIIAYNSSDERLKDNVTYIGKPLEKLQKIGGYEFDWNENQNIYSGHDVGVLAQEIESILPEAVKDRDSGFKGVQYDKIIPLLIESIKELNQKVEHLQNILEEKNSSIGKISPKLANEVKKMKSQK